MTQAREPRPLRGDEARLFEQLNEWLHGELRKTVRTDRENIEEACGRAWVLLLRNQPRRETIKAWLYTTARHEAIRLHKQRLERDSSTVSLDESIQRGSKATRGQTRVDTRGDRIPGRDQPAKVVELRERALDALEQLSPRERTVTLGRAAGYTCEQIAHATGDSVRTVERVEARAQQRLHELKIAEQRAEHDRPEPPLLTHVEEVISRRPRYLRDALGNRPVVVKDGAEKRLWWMRGVIAIERYRLAAEITDDRDALGSRPPRGHEHRARYDETSQVIQRVCDRLGLDRGLGR